MTRRSSIDELLARAQGELDRVASEDLADEVAHGAVVIDIRPADQRERDGDLPDAVVVDRNVLEWRLDPSSPHRLPFATDHDVRYVIVCNEGYGSSLAARSLREIGLDRATDLVGGFQAWREVVAGENARHWDEVVRTKDADQVSWYQHHPGTSLRLVESAPGSVIDVGAGTSSFIDHLLAAGRTDVTVLDVSEEALDVTHRRLGSAADDVSFVVADLVTWRPDRRYDVWHDRALFHFLTDTARRSHYIEIVSDAVAPGGIVVLATFAEDGPTHCSGLRTARYSPGDLAEMFSEYFELEHDEREMHQTPAQMTQPFTWVRLRRT